jgi:hypothetical protein
MTKMGSNNARHVLALSVLFLFYIIFFVYMYLPVGYGFMWGTVSPTCMRIPSKPVNLPRGLLNPCQSLHTLNCHATKKKGRCVVWALGE